MFDINTVLSAALSAAITEATKPLLERIATLESANDILHKTQHEDMVAMRDRITALEDTGDRLYARIAALEGDVSHTVQVQQANITAALAERVAALETNSAGTPATITADAFVTHLDNQEWFWEKLTRKAHEAAEAAVEEAMDEHTSTYDHDDYDAHLGDDDKHFDGDIEDAVRDALNGTSVTLSF